MRLDAIVKLGGSILRSAGDYLEAASRIRESYVEEGMQVAVVVSAVGGVTDLLVEATGGSQRAAAEVLERYESIARNLGGHRLARLVGELLAPLHRLPGAPAPSARAAARIVALGEAASRALMVYALETAGLRAVGVPASRVVYARGHPLAARVDYEATGQAWLGAVKALAGSGAVLVVEGFAASDLEGRPAVLGRGGSDYTATVLAALSGAGLVHLVTDVDGVYTGDPRVVAGARRVEAMGYLEALEAARFGAKRMHPRTFEPLAKLGPLEVRVGSWTAWSRVLPEPEVRPPGPKLVASRRMRAGAIVSLVGSGSASPALAARAVGALARAGVELASMHSTPSRASLAFRVRLEDESAALGALHALIEEGWRCSG